jgi:hypothetical protein
MKKLYAVKIVLPLVLAGLVSCTQSEQVTKDGEHFPIEWLNDYLSDPLKIEFFEWTPPVPFDGSNYIVCQTVENGEVISERNLWELNRQLLAEATKNKPLLVALKLNDVDEDYPGHGERFCRFIFPFENGYNSRSVEKLPGSFVSKKGDTWIPGNFAPMDMTGSGELPGTLIRFRTDPGIDPDTGEPTPVRDWSYRLVQRDASPEETPK